MKPEAPLFKYISRGELEVRSPFSDIVGAIYKI
jgi:hypothetical protein